jgi:hypothetical protein
VWALAYANPSARRAMLTVDSWPSIQWQLAAYAKAQRLSHCFLNFRSSVLALKSIAPNRNFEWLPFGFNDDVFHDRALDRDIYALSVGRRFEPFHQALRRYCESRGLVYMDVEGREEPVPLGHLSELAARSRYYVAQPPDLSDPIRTGGWSPLSLRYLEGIGAGCRLLGTRPKSGEFDILLPSDAIVECKPDGSDLETALDEADADPRFAEKADAASRYAHQAHRWSRRAEWIHSRLHGGPEQDLFSFAPPPS